jgi:hypothetical protein
MIRSCFLVLYGLTAFRPLMNPSAGFFLLALFARFLFCILGISLFDGFAACSGYSGCKLVL